MGVDDQARLYQTVVAGMSHPTLTPTQRMLLTEWLTQNTQVSQPQRHVSTSLGRLYLFVYDRNKGIILAIQRVKGVTHLYGKDSFFLNKHFNLKNVVT